MVDGIDSKKHILLALDSARMALERSLVLAQAAATTGTVNGGCVAPITLQLTLLRMLIQSVKDEFRKKAKAI